MKRILLSAVVLLSVSLSAQVGINTTSPEATLDVNGNVRVRDLAPESNPKNVVTVGDNNILRVATVNNGMLGTGVTGRTNSVSVGKTYVCNNKNNDKIVFFSSGAMRCTRGFWEYNGLNTAPGAQGASVGSTGYWTELRWGPYMNKQKVSNLTSGLSYWIGGPLTMDMTLPLQVIDDSQYKK